MPPSVIESGDYVSAQRFMFSPVQLGGSGLPKGGYMVLFTVETNDIDRVLADNKVGLHRPRNLPGDAMDYDSLLSYTFEALGPPISQRQVRRILAEETAAGRVPRLDREDQKK